MSLESRGGFDGDVEADEEFEREVQLAAEGDWAALGLDEPGAMEPVSIDELREK